MHNSASGLAYILICSSFAIDEASTIAQLMQAVQAVQAVQAGRYIYLAGY